MYFRHNVWYCILFHSSVCLLQHISRSTPGDEWYPILGVDGKKSRSDTPKARRRGSQHQSRTEPHDLAQFSLKTQHRVFFEIMYHL